MDLHINLIWFPAVVLSVIWGFYGCKVAKKRFWEKGWSGGWVEPFGIFFSEFIGSFAGWYCFYLLFPRLRNISALGNFDVFLGMIAVLGISGFSYKIVYSSRGSFLNKKDT